MQAPEFDFDHNSPEYAEDSLGLLDRARNRGSIVRSPHYGGFYVAVGYDAVADVARDDATFSSRHMVGHEHYQGMTIPESPVVFYPIELDPPEYTPYRKLLNPHFSPLTAKRLEGKITEWATIALDTVIESGQIDFVSDYTNAVSALFTCELLGLPTDEWRNLAEPIHRRTYTRPGTPEAEEAAAAYARNLDRIMEIVRLRRKEPADDLISHLVQAEIDGQPLDDDIIANLCRALVSGGFGTTASLAANSIRFLGMHPEQRQRLIDSPELIEPAVEEFLRYFTPNQGLARTVVRDAEVAGCPIPASSRLMLSWAGANHDPKVFDAPHEVNFERTPNRHVAFGLGLHRCIGSHFARMEVRVMLHEVLRRIPDYAIDHDRYERFPNIGLVSGIVRLPATFTSGKPEQAARLP